MSIFMLVYDFTDMNLRMAKNKLIKYISAKKSVFKTVIPERNGTNLFDPYRLYSYNDENFYLKPIDKQNER